jgi:phospholipid/cholesterol/gamma-HCH transport system permease protein
VRQLTVDAQGLDYCDGAGLGLFAELRRMAAESGGQVELRNPSPDLRQLLDTSQLHDPTARLLLPIKRDRLFVQVGKETVNRLADMREMLTFIGELTVALLAALRHPLRIRFRSVLVVAEKAGVNALPVVSLLGLLVGMILAFQTSTPLRQFGAEQLIPTIVSVAIVREMGPLITAVLLSGRSGSAFAAEIGTMKVTEELSAMTTMGLEPTQFLIIPRVLAALIVTPILTLYNMLLGIGGGYLVMASLGYSLPFYVNQVRGAITYRDLLGGVFKSFVFALIIAGVGCQRGVQTRTGPGAVGDSTTRAVVAGIVLTIVADAALGIVYFSLGI